MAYPPFGAVGAAQSLANSRLGQDYPGLDKDDFERAHAGHGLNTVAVPNFTDEMSAALAKLGQVICLACNDAEILRERLFGSWPMNQQADGSKSPPDPGNASALLAVVQTLTEHAVRLNETVQVLNARI